MPQTIQFKDKNLLINADNLEALKALFPAYEKRVEWVEFMRKRLSLACGLLREDGVLFISIDENEAAHLKLLCDAIFGEENYITQFVWQKKNKPSFLHKKISSMFEFVLCYAKDINKAPMLSIERTTESKPYPLNFKNNPLSTLSFEAQKVHFKLKVECPYKIDKL